MARLSFRCDEELVKRVDEARSHEPREHWLRRAVERALGSAGSESASPGPTEAAERVVPPAPAEQPFMSEVERQGFRNLTGHPRAHAENCKCPVCS